MRMTTVDILNTDNKQVVNGLFGHSFTIPKIGEKVFYLDKEYKVIDVKHELICVGSIIQTDKVTLIVNEIRHDLYT